MSVVNIKKKELNKNGYKDFEDWNTNPNHLILVEICVPMFLGQ